MTDYLNAEHPEHMPVRSPGFSHAVIARFVLPDRSEEWRPSRAVRWTPTHVLVGWEQGEDRHGRVQNEYVWLRADDVARVISRPPPDQDELAEN